MQYHCIATLCSIDTDFSNIYIHVPIQTIKAAENTLKIEILDLESELIIVHFGTCIQWINAKLKEGGGAVLVHCVYGQLVDL